jgi:hypothetical protein
MHWTQYAKNRRLKLLADADFPVISTYFEWPLDMMHGESSASCRCESFSVTEQKKDLPHHVNTSPSINGFLTGVQHSTRSEINFSFIFRVDYSSMPISAVADVETSHTSQTDLSALYSDLTFSESDDE